MTLNAVVTAVDSKYLPAACCALLSCVGAGEVDPQTAFFLLACGVSSDDAEKARSFLKGRGVPTEIFVIEDDRFQQFRVDSYVSAATYARLLLPQFFDDRWDRLLYLDADTRVVSQLKPLINASLHGKPIGAVHDYLRYMIYGMQECRERLSLRSSSPYFNAGVVCFDWRATVASGLLHKAQAFALESAHLCRSHDQDALNKAFEGAWTPLDPRWNLMTVAIPDEVFRLYYPGSIFPYISHFAGPIKPWTANFPERFSHHGAWYRDLLHGSPWPHFAVPATVSATPAPLGEDRQKGWFPAQRKSIQIAIKRLSNVGATAIRRRRNTKRDESNRDLKRLLDQMIAEAARP